MNKKKAILVVIGVLVLIFAIWNITWFVFMNNTYEPLLDAVNSQEHLVLEDSCVYDGYRYSVFPPSYLSFSGNLTISIYDDENIEDGETRSSLLIWPKINGEYEYGISLRVFDIDSEKDGFSFESYSFILDEKMEPLKELNPVEKEVYEQEKETIYLPWYMSMFYKVKQIEQNQIFEIDLSGL